ncbi:MAG: hypothetical protein ACFFDN_46225 [Candidatus Hodarchaeota archaeon]
MDEESKENLYQTFNGVIQSIIEDKKKDPKNLKDINKFEAKINFGLQIEKDYYYWMNLIAKDGEFNLSRGKIDGEHDLTLFATPEDLLFYCNGEYSTLNMIRKENKFGYKKLRIKKGTTGHNLSLLLKLPTVLQIDKIEY